MNRDIQSDALVEKRVLRAGRNVMVVVGIDRYRSWPKLHNAVSDARGAHKIFLQLGFEDAAPPLLDEMATGAALRQLATDNLAKLGGSDSLVVFFAGHGHTLISTFEDGQPVKTGYLVPVDGDTPRGSTATWLRIDNWLSDIARLPPRHILVILDTCYSGVALGSLIRWRGGKATAGGSLDVLQRRRSRRVITSALDDQRAMDNGPVPGHSLFTGCLIEALTSGLAQTGRHIITGSEIGLYVQERVASYPESEQTPDFGTLELDDRGELLIQLSDACPSPTTTEPSSRSAITRTLSSVNTPHRATAPPVALRRRRVARIFLLLLAIGGASLVYAGISLNQSAIAPQPVMSDAGIAAVVTDHAVNAKQSATILAAPLTDAAMADGTSAASDGGIASSSRRISVRDLATSSLHNNITHPSFSMRSNVMTKLVQIEQQLIEGSLLTNHDLHNMNDFANSLIRDIDCRNQCYRIITMAQCRLQNPEPAMQGYRQLDEHEQRSVSEYCIELGIHLSNDNIIQKLEISK